MQFDQVTSRQDQSTCNTFKALTKNGGLFDPATLFVLQPLLDQHCLIGCVNAEGKVISSNQLLNEKMGFSPHHSESNQLNLYDSEQLSPQFLDNFWQILYRGDIWQGELYWVGQQGQGIWVEASVIAELADNSETLFWFVATDCTAAKKQSLELQQMKQTVIDVKQEKNRFVANISHELRTPLHAILSFIEISQQNEMIKQDKDISHYMHIISKSAKRLLELVSKLLNLAKLKSGCLSLSEESFNFRELVQESAEELFAIAKRDGKLIVVEPANVPVIVKGDRSLLQVVITNLLSNALKFTANATTVVVQFGNCEQQGKSHLVVQIRDEGPGIPNDEVENIFDPFVQSSRTRDGSGGVGLGLAICKEVIQLHHGQIYAENAPNRGSIFTLLLSR